jgi:hypothetical protein
VLNILPGKEYGKELNVQEEGARFDDLDQLYQPEQLKIVKTYRFEGESDPSDMAVIFLIIAMEKKKDSS